MAAASPSFDRDARAGDVPVGGGRPRRIAALALMIAGLVAAVFATRIEFDSDLGALLPDRDPTFERARRLVENGLGRTVVDLSFEDEAGPDVAENPAANADRLFDAARALAARLEASEQVARAGDLVDLSAWGSAADALRDRAPLFVDVEELAAFVDASLREEALRDRLREVERRLHDPDGALAAAALEDDPLGVNALALRALEPPTLPATGARFDRGSLLDPTGRHRLFLIEPSFPPTEVERTERLLADLDAAVRDLKRDPRFAALVVRHVGAHRSTLDNTRQIERDVRRSSTLGITLVVLLAAITFRRLRAVILAVLPAVFGALVALGLFAVTRGSIPGAVVGFGAVLLAITIDYAIHTIFGHRGNSRANRASHRAVTVAATTTAAAFLALEWSSLPAMRDVGRFGAIGTLAAFLFARFVLPVALGRAAPTAERRRFDVRSLVRWARMRRRLRFLPVVALLVTPVIGYGSFALRTEGDVRSASRLSEAARADERAIEETWGSLFKVTHVVVEASTFEEATRENERLAALLASAAERGWIHGHGSIAPLAPSPERQAERRAAWERQLGSEARVGYAETLRRAARGTAFDGDALAARVVSAEGRDARDVMVSAQDYGLGGASESGGASVRSGAGALAPLVEDRLFETEAGVLIATPVYPADAHVDAQGRSGIEPLADLLAAELPGATVIDRGLMVSQLEGRILSEAGTIAALAFGIVLLIVTLWLRRVELVAIIAVPLLVSGGWTLGLLGWFGVPLTLANAVFLAFVFGLAVDYAVFLTWSRVERLRSGGLHPESDADDPTIDSDAAVLFCAATTGVGFGALAWADHPVLDAIGTTAAIGVGCAAVATLLFVPFLTGLVLRQPGPGGVFHWRYAWSTGVVIAELIGRGTIALGVAAVTRDPVRRQDRVLAAIRAACQRARRWVPIGHREVVLPEAGEAVFDRPCVIVANHESHADSVLLLALPTPAVILIKPWIGRVPILGRVVQRAGFHVVREGDAESLHDVARAAFARGVSLIGYPSDTRSRDGRIGRFHNGAFALARALDVDVVPVALVNTRTAMRPGTWWLGDHTLRAVVLDRVSPRDFTGDLADRRMARAVRDRIRAACDAHWPEVLELPGWEKPIEVLLRYLDPERARFERTWLRDPFLARLPSLLAGEGPIVVVGAECGALIARITHAFPLRRVVVIEPNAATRNEARTFAKPTAPIEWTDGLDREELPTEPTGTLTVIALTSVPPTMAAGLIERATRWRDGDASVVAWVGPRSHGDAWVEWLESESEADPISPTVSRFQLGR